LCVPGLVFICSGVGRLPAGLGFGFDEVLFGLAGFEEPLAPAGGLDAIFKALRDKMSTDHHVHIRQASLRNFRRKVQNSSANLLSLGSSKLGP
jgi:hypothetical protein